MITLYGMLFAIEVPYSLHGRVVVKDNEYHLYYDQPIDNECLIFLNKKPHYIRFKKISNGKFRLINPSFTENEKNSIQTHSGVSVEIRNQKKSLIWVIFNSR
ncbi:hypothetical protein [Pedobacter terrae]|nr:hypothetical protein [Pedobacter terrae]